MSFYVQLSLLFFFIVVDYTNYGVISIFVSNWFIMESYESLLWKKKLLVEKFFEFIYIYILLSIKFEYQ